MHSSDVIAQEQELQFKSFNEDNAWQLGNLIVNQCRDKKLPVAIDISLNGKQVFYHSLSGAPADLWYWIQRKKRLVNRINHSSMYMSLLLKEKNQNINQLLLLDEAEYAPHGGCFPIFIKDTGAIGTITLSGLAQEVDHEIVVESIKSYLKQASAS